MAAYTFRIAVGIATSYRVGTPRGVCCVTGGRIAPGEPYVAALRSDPETGELTRHDFSPDAWDARADVVAHWRGVMPDKSAGPRHRLPVDLDLMAELFRRLGDSGDRPALRFAVGLTLLRERRAALLETDGDAWHLRLVGGGRAIMVDPKLDEDALRDALAQVAALMADEDEGAES